MVFQAVESVGEEPLAQFINPKGGRKIGEREWQKAQGIFECQSVGFQGQDFGTDGDLVHDFPVGGVTVLQDEHAVIAFEVAEDGDDIAVVSVLVHSQLF